MRGISPELKQAMFWAILAARSAGEPNVMKRRLVGSLFRTTSVSDLCARAQIALPELIGAIEDPQALSFEECARRVHADLAEKGLQMGSREHIAGVQPLPMEPAVENVVRTVFEQEAVERDRLTTLEFLLGWIHADPALAACLASYGLSAEAINAALEEG